MGKYNFTALRVRQNTVQSHLAGKKGNLPSWVSVVRDIPPAQILVRNRPEQHQLVRQRLNAERKPVFEVQEKRVKPKKASRMYLPVQIKYEEDQLRKEFFRDHPWELARPRVLVESSGKDFENHDWSRLQQPGKKLDGERYVFVVRSQPSPATSSWQQLTSHFPKCGTTAALALEQRPQYDEKLCLRHCAPRILSTPSAGGH